MTTNNTKKLQYTSKNGVWKIYIINNIYMVEDTRIGGICDYPILNLHSEVLYDHPESIPKYIKAKVCQLLTTEA